MEVVNWAISFCFVSSLAFFTHLFITSTDALIKYVIINGLF